MTEDEARLYVAEHAVSRETLERLDEFIGLLGREAEHQNLIAASTMEQVWSRHIADSAQLLDLGPAGAWVDLGSGAGFPGLVIAALGRHVTLVEARPKRVAFLQAAAEVLGVSGRVEIIGGKVEAMVERHFDVITARAFAPLPRLLTLAYGLAGPATCWLLPKGRGAAAELEAVAGTWQGDFRIVPSVTDPESAIIVAREVSPRKRR